MPVARAAALAPRPTATLVPQPEKECKNLPVAPTNSLPGP